MRPLGLEQELDEARESLASDRKCQGQVKMKIWVINTTGDEMITAKS